MLHTTPKGWTSAKTDPMQGKEQNVIATYTSNGVNGHFPSIRFAPGLITLPFLLNFPLQPFSRAASISRFSSSPPSYSQHENATMSCKKGFNVRCRTIGWYGHKWEKTEQQRHLLKTKMNWDVSSSSCNAFFEHPLNHLLCEQSDRFCKSQSLKVCQAS